MAHERSILCASTALPLVLAAAAGVALPSPALANCTTAGVTTTCTNTVPNPWTTTIGTGPGFDGRTVNVLNGASVATVNAPAISLGDNATINVRTGGQVSGNTVSGEGNFGSGPNVVEFNSNGTLLVEQGASIVQTGSNNRSEAVNVHGFGNTLTNRGTIQGAGSAAIWFEDTTTGTPRNAVDNFGTITRVGGGPVFGTNGGAGIVFSNETGAVVNGSLSFAGGNDDLLFFAGSTVTGSIDGGGGTNDLTLQGAAGSQDTLPGALANFQTLTKSGLGQWTISGTLTGFQSTTVQQGTLTLTGNNADYEAGVLVQAAGTLEARAQSLPTTAANTGNVTNDGLVRFLQPVQGTYEGQIVGSGRVEKAGIGTTNLTAAHAYTGGTTVNAGALVLGAGGTTGSIVGDVVDNAVLGFDRSNASAFAGTISGTGSVQQQGSGTTTLTAANSYAGGTLITGGTLAVAGDASLGAAAGGLVFGGGTLRTTADVATARATTVLAGGGTFDTTAATLTHAGNLTGPGALAKTGTGTMVVTGTGSYAGGTTIAQGTLQLGNGGATGSIGGDVVDDGALVFDRSNALDFGGAISGSGSVQQVGTGTTRLNGGGSYAGPTAVAAGALYVNGNQAAATGPTTAAAGTTLGGAGTIGGDVTVADGATLAPGDAGTTPGQLTIGGDLALGPGSTLAYSFGQANVPGGPLNDLTNVGGNLTLDGTIDVALSPGGSLDAGVYRVFNYAGTLTDNGLAIGTIPATGFFVQTTVPQQVNLVNPTGLTLDWWDGDAGPKNNGVPNGGDGTWQNATGNDDWTDATGLVNAPFSDGSFAIFAGAPGTVTVDTSLGGVTAAGMQFMTDGYLVQGDPITLTGTPTAQIRVGDGTADGAATTAEISAELAGTSRVEKTDLGTLVLSGANSYAGGTAITGGVLEIADDANLGAAAGALTLDGGTLRTTADLTLGRTTSLGAAGGTFDTTTTTLTQASAITGAGRLTKAGTGTMVMTADNGYAGGTAIEAGTLQLGTGGTTGSITGDVANDGLLIVDRSDALTLDGAISGSGSLQQAGTGTTTLSGSNSYAGGTLIDDGTLSVSADANLGAAAGALTIDGGTLQSTASFAMTRPIELGAGGGTFATGTGGVLTANGAVTGAGALAKTGGGTLVLGGANGYLGGTRATGGVLQVAADAGLGDAAGPLAIDGAALATTASFATARDTTLGAGGGTFDTAAATTLTHDGVIAGAGGLIKAGAGDLVLTGANTFAGATAVDGGALYVDGDQSGATGATTANAGATLGGSGTIGGDVTVAGGAILSPGAAGTTPGTLTIAGNLTLAPTATLAYSFGQAGTVGGPLNDLTTVGGDLTLDGTLNVVTSPGGAFDPGIYRVISYAGALTDNGLALGTIPSSDVYVQTSVPSQVNLVNAAGLTLNWWDGDAGPKNDGVVDGGNGTWQSSAGNDNWTESTGAINAPFTNGAFAVFAGAAGTVTVDDGLGAVTVSGMQFLTDGYAVQGDAITLAGEPETTVRVGDGTAAGAAITTTIAAALTGDSLLAKTDLGTLILSGANGYTGGTAVRGGVLEIASDGNLGEASGGLEIDGGTLRTSAGITTDRETTLGAGGGTIDTTTATVAHGGDIGGSGGLTKAGTGTLTLTGTGTWTGGTTIAAGTLQLGNGGTGGSLVGDVANAGVLAFDRSNTFDLAGVVSGSGEVQQNGSGATRLSGANGYAGPTTVAAGALYVNGDQSAATGATTVASGATIGGTGSIGGDVTVADGATLAPGDLGEAPGALAIRGDLGLAATSVLDYGFGQAGVVGGPLNDLTTVAGDLALAGTLNVVTSAGGSFDPGVYRVIAYAGALTDNGLAIGTIPSPGFSLQTSIANQVNLINTAGLTLNWWDGDAGPKNDGVPNGGDGTWQSAAGNDNWTEATGAVNAPFADGSFAIFPGRSGTVTVDDGLGAVTVSGMQFLTDGYRVQGDAIGLVGDAATIRVGDGTADGALITATVASDLTGAPALVKTDLGRLVLAGSNGYAGGTRIEGGVLEISRDANLGAAAGGLAFDGGTLRTTGSLTLGRATRLDAGGGTFDTTGATLTETAAITGPGRLTKAGTGTLVLTADNGYAGGTTIAEGTLQLGAGGATGSIGGDVRDNGALAFDRSSAFAFDGAISGTGAVEQRGTGTTTLGGASSYGGETHVAAGTLEAGAANAFSAASAHVVDAAGTLGLADLDQTVASLANAGRVSLGRVPGTRLDVAGDYAGQGGVLHFTAELGGDDSPTDLMTVGGDTAGTGIVEVENAGGTGAETVDGIKIIDVAGASNGSFTLAGDFEFEGRQAVVAGAYAYSLYRNGVAAPEDGDWYLRSALIEPDGGGSQLQPGVPIYQGYPATLLALNGLPTMQERIGNRYWSGLGTPADGVEDKRAWARIEASHGRLQPDVSDGDAPSYDLSVTELQVGIDRPVRETDDGGVLVAGATFDYGTVDNDVSSDFGDGEISSTGYGFGGSLTWFRGDGIYVDGQAQLAWYDSDLSSDLVDGKLASGNDGFGWALGVEGGKRIPISDQWTLTPQGQVFYSSVDFDGFDDTFGARVTMRDGASMPVRLGLALDQEQSGTDDRRGGVRSHLYGIANLYYDLIDRTEVAVDGTAFRADNRQAWGSLGVGGTYTWKDGAYGVYGEGLVATSLSDFGDDYGNRITIGFRAAW